MRTASLTINLTGDKDLQAAALQIVNVALQPMPDSDAAAVTRHIREQSTVPVVLTRRRPVAGDSRELPASG